MGRYVNRGFSSFKRAKESEIYVDKTGLLEYTNSVINTEQCFVCSSRPRRFGKSMTAGMLSAYYGKGCDSRELFEDLKIARSASFEKHLNRYDVIHLDLSYLFNSISDSSKMLLDMQEYVLSELKEIYPGVLTNEDRILPFALSRLHYEAGAEFIFIIDEWDMIFREDKLNRKAQEEYIRLLRGLFKGEQSKDFIRLAYLTGILPIKKYNSESALNNFKQLTMINPARLSEYIGFTEEEVKELCQRYDMDFSEAAWWYDGYSFKNVKHVYNPNSVVNAMIDGDYNSYWTGSNTYTVLKDYICMNFDGLRDSVVQMIAGGRCKVDTETFENDMTSFRSRDDVLTVLIHLGYLAYDKEAEEVYIPNKEIRMVFKNAVKLTEWTPVIQAIEKSNQLLQATWEKDADAVARGISEVHMANTSILQYNNENALSCVITLAYYNALNEYTLIREMPAGKGYADIVFLPRKCSDKPAMVVELKYDKTPESAMEQIKERQYPEALKEYQGKVLLVGINYDKDSKTHDCVIEEWKR